MMNKVIFYNYIHMQICLCDECEYVNGATIMLLSLWNILVCGFDCVKYRACSEGRSVAFKLSSSLIDVIVSQRFHNRRTIQRNVWKDTNEYFVSSVHLIHKINQPIYWPHDCVQVGYIRLKTKRKCDSISIFLFILF